MKLNELIWVPVLLFSLVGWFFQHQRILLLEQVSIQLLDSVKLQRETNQYQNLSIDRLIETNRALLRLGNEGHQ